MLSLDGDVLREMQCFFGGGTAIVLMRDEFRESVDIDFLVSDARCYGELRSSLRSAGSLAPITREGVQPIALERDLRADQYGVRCRVLAGEVAIKLELVREARIDFDPADAGICGVPVLSGSDLAASKLLANSDRWADDGVLSRDIIDLAMLNASRHELARAYTKASAAYGQSIEKDLNKAIDKMVDRSGWLDRCMNALSVSAPKALVLERIKALRRVVRG
ncbi:hypothetical protein FHR99_003088 [Litorivivens lipolytica]|uniref:Nucleotidyl transferase AbiEii toxin, Type IV TA system n=1 Tax=Litorivivens lipolytica TaxID=1524264 RepID=A0A7W4Z6S0_9GAMM|nr:nucleotidyl transferase AbiEii/AbiGii toxin family protein [Litorivivens lipolytica]MBB3048814.1 hypothetical protein [Litorivivens lipolytica]